MSKLIYEKETFDILGSCFKVQNELGVGFLEIVYKDALEIELGMRKIFFESEKEYIVQYRNVKLSHNFYADFVLYGKIILGVKPVSELSDAHYAQSINNLKVSKQRIELLVNFGQQPLEYKRIIL